MAGRRRRNDADPPGRDRDASFASSRAGWSRSWSTSEKIAECKAGNLVGEIGVSTGDPATATAVCASPVRYLSFDTGRLYGVLDRHTELQDALELAIQRSLRDKIHRQNFAAAHTAGGAAP